MTERAGVKDDAATLPGEASRARLSRRMPRLFHLTEAGSGERIRAEGLLSTRRLLDRDGIEGAARDAIEGARRPVPVALPGGGVIRDNGVLNEALLARVLTDGMTPRDWYRLLNAHVFLWPGGKGLRALMGASAYRGGSHDVLTFDGASLIAAHRPRVRLTPINTGATQRTVPPRGPGTFLPFDAWPPAPGDPLWTTPSGRPRPVREVAIEDGIPDARDHLVSITRITAGEVGGGVDPR